jgi:hypothetical protein
MAGRLLTFREAETSGATPKASSRSSGASRRSWRIKKDCDEARKLACAAGSRSGGLDSIAPHGRALQRGVNAWLSTLPCRRANGDSKRGGEDRREVCAQSRRGRALKHVGRNPLAFRAAFDPRVAGVAHPGLASRVGRVFWQRSEHLK